MRLEILVSSAMRISVVAAAVVALLLSSVGLLSATSPSVDANGNALPTGSGLFLTPNSDGLA